MFVANAPHKNTILLDAKVGEYLTTHGIPLLSFEGDKYVFTKTVELETALKKLPRKFKNIIKKGGG